MPTTSPALGQYTVSIVGSVGGGSFTFAQLGVTAAKLTVATGGVDDNLELTVNRSIYDEGMAFVPQGRHHFYSPDGALRFVGWLSQPKRNASSAAAQTQTFRFDGPWAKFLKRGLYRTPWRFWDDTAGGLVDRLFPRCILHRALKDEVPEAYRDGIPNADGAPIRLRRQIQLLLDYAIAPPMESTGTLAGFDGLTTPAPITYGSLNAIDGNLQPPEDEQSEASVGALLLRELRWVPEVAPVWNYTTSGDPQLLFVAPATAAVKRLNLKTDRLKSFASTPRFDLVVRKVRIEWVSDSTHLAADGTPYARRQVEESVTDNGSDNVVWLVVDLRGASGRSDGPPAEPVPGSLTPGGDLVPGLAARLHAPFKVLTHALQWSRDDVDVDWSLTPGMVVTPVGGTDPLLGGTGTGGGGGTSTTSSSLGAGQSILQTITRDLATGTTSCEAGPPSHLGLDDLRALFRHGKTRNAGRGGVS